MSYDYRAHFGEVTLTQDLMSRKDERRWRLTAPPPAGEHHDVVLYLGCNVLRTSHMVRTVTAIFDLLGLDYVAVGGPSYCCGIVHHQQGDTQAARGMSQGTIRLFERFSPREVVMWCPSCIYFYDEVQQLTLPFPFRQAAEFLVEQLPRLTFTREVRRRVALHSHVHNDARRREGAAGRRLLESVPGLTFVAVEPEPRFGRICTAAVQQQLGLGVWNGLLRDELARAQAGGADALATIYHGCQRLICRFEAEGPLAIEHYLSVFARGLGLEFEDTYKRWMLSGDREAILADATPCMEANGVDSAAARALVERTFVPCGRPEPAGARTEPS
ncbi:MAG TPA: heterodisulfide reductase-related iron-sulfur binding cluster [Methylomirabilota bacterium]|nr:heterodisulfide reductase-related iron-sulfur binding cluster [Methylomirabilota bacterium]